MKVFVTGGSGFIGTPLVDLLQEHGATILNYDWAPPIEPAHQQYWRRGDIMNAADLAAAIDEFQPTHVVHLAARCDVDDTISVADYAANSDGTANLLAAVQHVPTIERLIITSTQMVCQPGYMPRHDEDFSPHTVYGHSKVLTERLTREADLACTWTIIRPTNIWGPRHPRHSVQFFSLLERGVYWHPSGRSARRAWGYVVNVAWQIQRILEMPAEEVDRQVFYVGDAPFDLVDWVNGVAQRLTGRKAKFAPRSLLYLMALAGEAAQRCGLRAPLSLLRYKAMTEDYLPPIERTLEVVGAGPYTMDQGIDETLAWLAAYRSGTARIAAHVPPASKTDEQPAAEVAATRG